MASIWEIVPYGPDLYTILFSVKKLIHLVFPEHFNIFGCHVTAPNISIGDVIHGVVHQISSIFTKFVCYVNLYHVICLI